MPKTLFPKSPVTINFDLEVANKLVANLKDGEILDTSEVAPPKSTETDLAETDETPAGEEELNFPEILDPTKKITKSKAKKSKSKSKIPQRQSSKEKEKEKEKEKDKKNKGKSDVDVEWDFEEPKASGKSSRKNETETGFPNRKTEEPDFLKSEPKAFEEERFKDDDVAPIGRHKGKR